MKLSSPLFLISLIINISCCAAQEITTVWKLIAQNKNDEAQQLLETKMKNNTASIEDYVAYMSVMTFKGKDDELNDFLKYVKKSENPAAYTYALWFTQPVAGPYGFKNKRQTELLNSLLAEKPGNGTLKAAAHYVLSHHYFAINETAQARKECLQISALENWQFTGPFDNISGSGFNKIYDPIKESSSSAVFTSKDKAPIKWFEPKVYAQEGWIFPLYYVTASGGNIIYAQTFVQSPVEQDVLLCAGISGNIKVWVNDQLLIKEAEEKVTELDAYKNKCHLNSGYNRILVQIGGSEKTQNFIVRLTDENFNPVQGLSSVAGAQSYKKQQGDYSSNSIPHFAEVYFAEKIKKEPENLTNYVLLYQTLLRGDKVFEARKVIEDALKRAPECSILKFELLQCYLKENNRTGISECVEYFRETESLMGIIFKCQKLQDEERYPESLDMLEERIRLYGKGESTYEDKIQLYSKLEKIPELLEIINEAYGLYPTNPTFANYVFNIEKNVNKNPGKAIKVIEDYLNRRYSSELTGLLVKEYFAQNEPKKAFKLLENQIDKFPYDATFRENLLTEFYMQQNYTEAYEAIKSILEQKPFSGYYMQLKATIEVAMNKKEDAIASFRKALLYQPTLYEARDKLRALEGKKPVCDASRQIDIENLIAATGKKIDVSGSDYYYLVNDDVFVLYPEGGKEERFTTAIKILNERGIDNFKESNLYHDKYTESLVIEEALLIKPNGKKLKPAINDGIIVWEGLQVNDIIYVKYKKKYFQSGKRAREFVDNYNLSGFSPVELSRYSLIIPAEMKINYTVENGNVEPEITDFENFKIYTWEMKDVPAVKDEPYMPALCDVGPALHISTMNDWNEVAKWYSDVVYSKISTDYTLKETYIQLFPGNKPMTSDEKARTIYNYIANNISYSSVSFLQNDVIPQKASRTINTHLGDCKDLSTLFVSLANLCGLKANLVLIDTRDNGSKALVLPSFNFNHCIVKYFNEKNEEIFLELTDRNLPFRSIPATLHNALSLTIPVKDDTLSRNVLAPLNIKNKTRDNIKTNIVINLSGEDLKVKAATTKYGNPGTFVRSRLKDLNGENLNKETQEMIGQFVNNPVTIENISFEGLDSLVDSVSYKVDFAINKQVKKIGNLQIVKIPFMDIIFENNPFNLESRQFDFEYWNYEYADGYETTVELNLPAGKALKEIPQNLSVKFHNIEYSLTYTKVSDTKLKIHRKASIQKNNISPEDYAKFKEFALKIISQEEAYIAFQ